MEQPLLYVCTHQLNFVELCKYSSKELYIHGNARVFSHCHKRISENLVLSQITNKGAWCGGVRYKIGNTTDCFKWGTVRKQGKFSLGEIVSTPVQEPNNGNVSDRLYENYIEINADNNTFEWNDLPETGNHTITGFFVEFGNSAPGNSDQGSASVATASIVVTAQSFFISCYHKL